MWKFLNDFDSPHEEPEKGLLCDYTILPPASRLTLPDYVVLDIETTGFSAQKDAIIEIGAVKVHEMEITDQFQSLVNPGRAIPKSVTKLTGITDRDVQNAPGIHDVCAELNEFLRERFPIVGHNVTFDLRFISAAFNRAKISAHFSCIDTVTLARDAFPGMENYKMETLITSLGLLDHAQKHRAIDDVTATLKLYLSCRWLYNRAQSLQVEYPTVWYRKDAPKKQPHYQEVRIKDIKPTVEVIETGNPLYGKTIVFTGELSSVSREDAMQMAVNCGALLRTSPSGKTNYLVVGKKDPDFVDENGMSKKECSAWEFNNSGKGHIIFLDERQFMEIVTKRGTWVKQYD